MDFSISEEGELQTDPKSLDIKIISDDDERFQQAFCRIKSVLSNWRNEIGADLEKLVSLPVNSNTFSLCKEKITNALIKDDVYNENEIYIEQISDEDTLKVKVFLRNKDTVTCKEIDVSIDLVFGINLKIGED